MGRTDKHLDIKSQPSPAHRRKNKTKFGKLSFLPLVFIYESKILVLLTCFQTVYSAETDDSPFYSVSEVCHLELDAKSLTTDSQLESIITDDESDLANKLSTLFISASKSAMINQKEYE